MSDAVSRLAAALTEVAGAPVELERPSDPSHGDYATNVALRLAGQLQRPPREVAAELAGRAAGLAGVERVEVAGPGFLNVFLDDSWFTGVLAAALAAGETFGSGSAAVPERVQVEMVSAMKARGYVVADDNEADALAVLDWALAQDGPGTSGDEQPTGGARHG